MSPKMTIIIQAPSTTTMSAPSHMPTLEAIDDTTGVIIPDPATIQSIAARRTKAGRLIAGTAAPVNVPLYKDIDQHKHKPKAKRWDRM